MTLVEIYIFLTFCLRFHRSCSAWGREIGSSSKRLLTTHCQSQTRVFPFFSSSWVGSCTLKTNNQIIKCKSFVGSLLCNFFKSQSELTKCSLLFVGKKILNLELDIRLFKMDYIQFRFLFY